MRSNYVIWVYSPGNVRGIGLLVIAATVNETGVVDLNEISPEKWGNLPHNLIELHKFYPVAASLGFRLPLRYLQSLIDIPEFPSDLKIFFVLTGGAVPAELQLIKDFPQFNFYIEVHSSNELSSVESYCGTHHIPLT
ncbi:MAG TPA: hypothetical protein VFX43_03305, partial [Chitinophagaceae bacterium]|nr:hypothetical protein [Chitinophagaceae bacterium]